MMWDRFPAGRVRYATPLPFLLADMAVGAQRRGATGAAISWSERSPWRTISPGAGVHIDARDRAAVRRQLCVRPIRETTGKLRCEEVLLHADSRIASSEGKVLDGAGRLVAHGSETYLISTIGSEMAGA